MRARLIRNVLMGLVLVLFPSIWGSALSQEPEPELELPEVPSLVADNLSGPALAKRPFTVRAVVDSRVPSTYSDTLMLSVWITPTEPIALEVVRVHPKGDLVQIYNSFERLPKDAYKEGASPTELGLKCRTRENDYAQGLPFFASCEIDAIRTGWRRWVTWNIFMSPGRQKIDIEIAISEGAQETSTYFEAVEIEFISAKPTIILGGFFGAFLLSIFMALSTPIPPDQISPVGGWRELWIRATGPLPHNIMAWARESWRVLRHSLLGGACALVLIVTAQSTEGFSPPISVRIQDFWGGVVVGLLSVPLAKWLRDKLAASW